MKTTNNKNGLTFKAIANAKNAVNEEYRSLSLCLKLIRKNWHLFSKEAKTAGITLNDLTPKFLLNTLNNKNIGKGEIENYLVVDNDFCRRKYNADTDEYQFIKLEAFTPNYVFKCIVKAGKIRYEEAHAFCKNINKEIKEQMKK